MHWIGSGTFIAGAEYAAKAGWSSLWLPAGAWVYAFYGGEWRTVPELLEVARASGVRHVGVTGGGPLAPRSCLELLGALCDAGFAVSLETSGAMDIAPVDPRVSRVVDLKTPGSGEGGRNRLANLDALRAHDQVKIVVCSRADYEWARDLLRGRAPLACQVLISPWNARQRMSWNRLRSAVS